MRRQLCHWANDPYGYRTFLIRHPDVELSRTIRRLRGLLLWGFLIWSKRRESNSQHLLGGQRYYRYTTPALVDMRRIELLSYYANLYHLHLITHDIILNFLACVSVKAFSNSFSLWSLITSELHQPSYDAMIQILDISGWRCYQLINRLSSRIAHRSRSGEDTSEEIFYTIENVFGVYWFVVIGDRPMQT